MNRTLTISAQRENLEQVQGFIDDLLADRPWDPTAVLNLQIAVEELFVNIASYAYAPGQGDVEIACTLDEAAGRITVQFRDRGIPFNPLDKEDADITLSAEERGIGGLGIYMVKNSMDAVAYDYRDGQNIMTIEKNLT